MNQYNNTYHHSVGEKPINADYSVWTKKFEINSKVPSLK